MEWQNIYFSLYFQTKYIVFKWWFRFQIKSNASDIIFHMIVNTSTFHIRIIYAAKIQHSPARMMIWVMTWVKWWFAINKIFCVTQCIADTHVIRVEVLVPILFIIIINVIWELGFGFVRRWRWHWSASGFKAEQSRYKILCCRCLPLCSA